MATEVENTTMATENPETPKAALNIENEEENIVISTENKDNNNDEMDTVKYKAYMEFIKKYELATIKPMIEQNTKTYLDKPMFNQKIGRDLELPNDECMDDITLINKEKAIKTNTNIILITPQDMAEPKKTSKRRTKASTKKIENIGLAKHMPNAVKRGADNTGKVPGAKRSREVQNLRVNTANLFIPCIEIKTAFVDYQNKINEQIKKTLATNETASKEIIEYMEKEYQELSKRILEDLAYNFNERSKLEYINNIYKKEITKQGGKLAGMNTLDHEWGLAYRTTIRSLIKGSENALNDIKNFIMNGSN
jgi:hypothetical protein